MKSFYSLYKTLLRKEEELYHQILNRLTTVDTLKKSSFKERAENISLKLSDETSELMIENAKLSDEKSELMIENGKLSDEKSKLIIKNGKLAEEKKEMMDAHSKFVPKPDEAWSIGIGGLLAAIAASSIAGILGTLLLNLLYTHSAKFQAAQAEEDQEEEESEGEN